ncbi:beta-class carbonic anhydrase [Dendrosporobacter sp. 1207_IL3150]|uniref:beta-class carbonic anhydrase n=1 Tax=Dendrosporobacter sp. 1207_IL3150 TaxID=3084054 RepID=UPI002FDA683D
MNSLEQILAANRQFVEHLPSSYESEENDKMPNRHLAIFTCMDTRLVEFLEPALGLGRGEAKMIKNAGNTITGPFEAIMRSLILSVFELGVNEIIVIGHHDCGMANTTSQGLTAKMLARGISPDAIKMVEHSMEKWLDTFHHPEDNVKEVVEKIRTNPLIPKDVPVHGLMFHPRTGKIEVIVDGYSAANIK